MRWDESWPAIHLICHGGLWEVREAKCLDAVITETEIAYRE